MIKRLSRGLGNLAVVAGLSAASAVNLSGCEENTKPTPQTQQQQGMTGNGLDTIEGLMLFYSKNDDGSQQFDAFKISPTDQGYVLNPEFPHTIGRDDDGNGTVDKYILEEIPTIMEAYDGDGKLMQRFIIKGDKAPVIYKRSEHYDQMKELFDSGDEIIEKMRNGEYQDPRPLRERMRSKQFA